MTLLRFWRKSKDDESADEESDPENTGSISSADNKPTNLTGIRQSSRDVMCRKSCYISIIILNIYVLLKQYISYNRSYKLPNSSRILAFSYSVGNQNETIRSKKILIPKIEATRTGMLITVLDATFTRTSRSNKQVNIALSGAKIGGA